MEYKKRKRKKVTLFVLPDFRIFKVKIIGVGQRRKHGTEWNVRHS